MRHEPRDYQEEAVESIFGYFRSGKNGNPLVVAPTGCHAAGTLVLMHDGSVKPVESVEVGDLLMGPDSQPRTVLQLARGREPMYRVTPKKGEPFVVNEGHVLSLKTTNEGRKWKGCTTGREFEAVSVRDYLGKSRSWKHLRKLHRAAVDFAPRQAPPLDPWCMGVLLGDGSVVQGTPNITNPDHEVCREFHEKMEALGLRLRWSQKPDNKAYLLSFRDPKASKIRPNRLVTILRGLSAWGCGAAEKFIPDAYKLGSREVRLEVLAGLIDTDGHLARCGFDFISKSRRLSEDVVFICRSLGLWAKVAECEKFCQTGGGGTYWRVSISGDLDTVPTRVPRKQAPPRRQKKNPLVTGLSVEPVGEGEFYGFRLDSDHLYLTADFVVHHNSGKSLILAEFIKRALELYPETNGQPTRVVVLSHVKELLAQDFTAIRRQWADAPVGLHSAGLKRRDTRSQVIVAGIQSCYRRASDLYANLVLVDEAHLIPRKTSTMYGRFLKDMRSINPSTKVIGFTATPYRLDSGLLTEGKDALFDEVCHEISIRRLVEEGYLSPLRSKTTDTQLDVRGVAVRGGEYVPSELQAAVDTEDLNRAIVSEIVAAGEGRRSWLVFCAGVEHARHVAELLDEHGVSTATVFGDTPDHERDAAIARFKSGQVQAMVNVAVLTTGFDAPRVDLLALLRPTKSTGLYMQMVGRAMRIAEGKDDGLVLDFAGNVERHGPVDAVRVQGGGRGGEGVGTAPTKTCPECREIVTLFTAQCPACDFEFPPPPKPEEKLSTKPSKASVMSFGEPEWVEVAETELSRHEKKGKPDSLRVDHWRGGLRDLYPLSEWVCLEHGGFAQSKAARWWVQGGGDVPVPSTVSEALERAGELRKVLRVAITPDEKNPKFTRIVRRELGERPLPWELPVREGDVEQGPWEQQQQEEDEPCPF